MQTTDVTLLNDLLFTDIQIPTPVCSSVVLQQARHTKAFPSAPYFLPCWCAAYLVGDVDEFLPKSKTGKCPNTVCHFNGDNRRSLPVVSIRENVTITTWQCLGSPTVIDGPVRSHATTRTVVCGLKIVAAAVPANSTCLFVNISRSW